MKRAKGDAAGQFIVTWCGSPCAGNPHKTREAAERWIEDAHAARIAAKQPMYGNYAIVEKRTRT